MNIEKVRETCPPARIDALVTSHIIYTNYWDTGVKSINKPWVVPAQKKSTLPSRRKSKGAGSDVSVVFFVPNNNLLNTGQGKR